MGLTVTLFRCGPLRLMRKSQRENTQIDHEDRGKDSMSIRREKVLLRVRSVLVDLEGQSEGRAMSWDSERISHGKPGSTILVTSPTDFETVLKTLEAWCSEAEKRVVRGRPKPET